ncbi:hydroxyacid dehydrogenase [Haloprofundus marisrubri]|uniref:Hydroxyacid dehydrogenase n=1 Tax=Haloprofundus marisrubri TaxID=1514971 RepID=A0A0W1R542_9EURY|nr:D-2-hydroxyacid dehydrogenase [Haloprofundus marisrubri]KTG08410.1 hydroxyacid dehydrogenase [Haloprofundus marisrubri]
MAEQLTIGVLRGRAHGRSSEEAAEALRERLPDHEIRYARTRAEELAVAEDADVLVGLRADDELLEASENLRIFAAGSAGVDHLPLDAFEAQDVAVTNASGVHGPNMAEHVLATLLSLTRRLDVGMRQQRRREWRRFQTRGELYDSTVTVVGLGAIGEALVERLSGFGVHTIGVRYSPEKGGPTDEVIGFDDEKLADAFARTDALVLACPLTETTRGLVDDDAFRTLPTDSILVNVARGPVVDTDALVSALQSNSIAAAALDVTDPEPLPEDHPLWTFGNVIITPHSAGDTPQYWQRVADIVAENVEQLEEGGEDAKLRNRVEF